MAITTVRTPIGPYAEEDDVELLWNSTSGSGFDSGAVGCPIFVDGYMYAYAGANILKLDPATGETLISKPMEDASDFAIIPPTYGDGMIFVGLKNGRVQAFRAGVPVGLHRPAGRPVQLPHHLLRRLRVRGILAGRERRGQLRVPDGGR
mgnify:CR=1 FL=1